MHVHQTANPIIVIDEIGKTHTTHNRSTIHRYFHFWSLNPHVPISLIARLPRHTLVRTLGLQRPTVLMAFPSLY